MILQSMYTGKRLALTALVLCLFGGHALAGNTWTGGGSSPDWSDANNWGGGAPAYGTLTFTTGGTQGTASNNNSIGAMNKLSWDPAVCHGP